MMKTSHHGLSELEEVRHANADTRMKSIVLAKLNEEIANLTRTPLGEGDLVLKNWIQYSLINILLQKK